MSPHVLGILIGGICAAVFFGLGNIFVKMTEQAGMGISGLLLGFCIGAGIVSGATYIIDSGHGFSGKALGLAVLAGAFGALGMSCVSFALTKYETPLSVLAPIFNANTLITVLVALWLFSEWKHVQVHQLIIGAILIVAGSTLVARA